MVAVDILIPVSVSHVRVRYRSKRRTTCTPTRAPFRIVLPVGAPASRWAMAFVLLITSAVFAFVSLNDHVRK